MPLSPTAVKTLFGAAGFGGSNVNALVMMLSVMTSESETWAFAFEIRIKNRIEQSNFGTDDFRSRITGMYLWLSFKSEDTRF